MQYKDMLRALAALSAVCVLGFGLYFMFAPPAAMPASTTPQPAGSIIITVQDGSTGAPLPNATVVIPETGQRCTTGADGRTPLLQVPIYANAAYQNILPQTWGEITVLAYCPGYADYALLHVHVWENQTRSGPTILMFSTDETGAELPFTLTEGPHRLWVQQLLNKYRSEEQ